MLQSIVDHINLQLCELVAGAKVYGIARTAQKEEGIIMPISGKEWIDYAGIDDIYPFMAYHKEQSLSSSFLKNGYGDSMGDLANTYGMSLVIFFNEIKLGVKTSELYTLIQTRITGILKIDGYKQVRISVINAILNDAQVWRQEYGNADFRLSATQRLIQIGYSVLVTLDKNCFPKCISNS